MLRQFCKNSLLFLVCGAFLSSWCYAALSEKIKREPVVITSNSMEADQLGDTVTFTGNVMLKKAGMTVTSDAMVVFYDARSKDIKEIDAFGNVVVHKEGRVAYSNKASYYSHEEKIVLSGDARIIEHENQLRGDTITLFMNEDRSVVEGGKIMFYQNKQEKPGVGESRR